METLYNMYWSCGDTLPIRLCRRGRGKVICMNIYDHTYLIHIPVVFVTSPSAEALITLSALPALKKVICSSLKVCLSAVDQTSPSFGVTVILRGTPGLIPAKIVKSDPV